MRRFRVFLLVLMCLSTAISSAEPAQAPSSLPPAPSQPIAFNCETISLSKRILKYCYEPPSSKRTHPTRRVFYYFHGIGQNPESLFQQFGSPIHQVNALLGPDGPAVVSLSFGPEGIVREDAAELVMMAIPEIEKVIGVSEDVRRDLVGASMGGHNVLRLAAARPSMFRSVALLCPALVGVDLFDNEQADAYRARHAAYLNVEFYERLIKLFHQEFVTREDWFANDPFRLMDIGVYDGLPIFLSVGRQDGLGFFEGSEAFVNQARGRGIAVDWHPVEGGHCSIDSKALTAFLLSGGVPPQKARAEWSR